MCTLDNLKNSAETTMFARGGRDFPTDTALHDQYAGEMHAVAGKYFFDANHQSSFKRITLIIK